MSKIWKYCRDIEKHTNTTIREIFQKNLVKFNIVGQHPGAVEMAMQYIQGEFIVRKVCLKYYSKHSN